MAIVNNLWLRGTKKRLAGTVVYQSMGQTIQRELAASVTNPRTEAQMQQRVRWANIVSLYRTLKPMMKYAFESKKRTQSDYNAFMSANITNSPIALTKQEAAAGACVVAPYIITRGSLPSIQISASDAGWMTDIYTGDLDDWADCTVGEFAKAVIDNNPGIQRGDQLSFIRCTQMVNGTTGIPYVILRKYEILMDTSSRDLAVNYLPQELLQFAGADNNFQLEVINNGSTGAFTMIISRTISGRTLVSTQQLQPVNMEQMITAYSSPEQLAGAIASYGESEDAFLSSNTANYGQGEAVALAALYARVGDSYLMPQSYAGLAKDALGKTLGVRFNADVKVAPERVNISTSKGYWGAANVAVQNDYVLFTFAGTETFEEGEVLTKFTVTIDGVAHTIPFTIYSPGLE